MRRNGSFGRPGTSAERARSTAPATSGRALAEQLAGEVVAEVACSDAARVTMMPVAVEISSAGIWAREPVADRQQRVVLSASANGMPCWMTPIDDAAREVDRR